MNIENAAGDSIQSYCVFDSDYHTHQAKCARFEAAKNKGIQLHIWSMKEIENYFIEPVAILRLIKNEGRKNHQDIRLSDIEAALYRITDDMENEVFDAFANEYYSENKSKGTTYANRKARAILTANWSDSSERLRLVSGKTVISKLSEWSHETFGFSFGVTKLARAIRPSEFSTELKNVVNAIDSGNRFPGRLKDLALSKTLCAEEMEETSTSS